MGDETQEQKGTAPANTMGPPTGMTDEEIAAALKNIKLAPGFKIDVYASGVNSARQMAWGDKGTLFVGSFSVGTVYAILDEGGKKQVKAILKGLKMPTGVAFGDGALYVADIDKIYRIAAPYGKVRPAHARATAFRRYLRANLK
jgi:glucose/arabinose dehydrogenase